MNVEETSIAQLQAALGTADGPTKWLLTRAEQRLAASEAPFEPVFAVETK